MSYNVLIIGAGNKGALADAPGTGNRYKYLSYAHTINAYPGFELLGFVDKDVSKTMDACIMWDISNVFPSISAGMVNGKPDIAIISTPDDTHYDILKQLVGYPLNIVICEKPLCSELWQAREIIELYRQKNIPLLVDYTRRFIPQYRQIKAEIDSGKYGAFLNGFCYFNRGWLHTASHFIDMALWFNGSLDKITIHEIPTDYRWVYQWGMFYEKDFASENAVN
ncbi:MAG: Gfo/Idh/MocA family oxidoreductase, partial [Bacteroidales bacterium]